LGEELNYIKGLFPYNLKPYKGLPLIYTHSLLAFSSSCLNPDEASLGWKVKNLAAGIEMLGMGCDFHLFDVNNFAKKLQDKEDNYTLNLLFGDVFYSRAVNYLVRFEDSLVFEEVINSLKQIHESRLILHRQLLKVIDEPALLGDIVDEKPGLLLGINSLFKNCFLIGWSIFPAKGLQTAVNQLNHLYKIINHMTLLKSLQELNSFLLLISRKLSVDMDLGLVEDKKNFIKNQLSDIISQLNTDWLKIQLSDVLDIVLGRG